MTDTVLDVRNLKVQFISQGRVVSAVDGIDFQLTRGKTLGIVGESGSGKSVTSLGVMGLVPKPGIIAGGEIWFTSSADTPAVNLETLKEEQRRNYRGKEIAMIFQEPMSSLNPVYNIGFQITEAILLHQNVSPVEARRQAIASLQEVKLLPRDEKFRESYLAEYGPTNSERAINEYINERKRAILKRYPHELSGGQLQRVMIAMAIACNPTLLIADEPTTALDVTVQATILDLLRELCSARGMSMIFITHDLGVIAEIADHVAVMYQGKIVEEGTVENIFVRPNHPYTKGLLACRPSLDSQAEQLPTVSDFMDVSQDSNGELLIIEKTTALPVEPKLVNNGSQGIADSSSSSSPPLLEVKNLHVGFPLKGVLGQTKRYFIAVNGVSFAVYPGETLGLVGESGCGKSTLARTLLRLNKEMQGQIIFEGRDITNLKGKSLRRLRSDLQIVFQNPYNSLNPRRNIGKTILEPLTIHNWGQNKRQRQERVAYLLDRVGLNPAWTNRYPHEFSGGQRQRVCIARALALNPKFIICDESVSALDVSIQAQVLNLLKELQAEFRLTYIFISHDLSVVKFMSDRIMVMNKGQIEEIAPAEQIYRAPEKEYTRKLIASIPTAKWDKPQYASVAEANRDLPLDVDPWVDN
ncbi:MAG: ABC transporter ATP-binding protein [Spirulinaceae cyanobacterium]